MKKRFFVGMGILGFLLTAGSAFAQTATSTPAGTVPIPTSTMGTTSTSNPVAKVLEVGAGGNVLLRGTIEAISNGSMTVQSWGGEWTVNIPSSAEIFPKGSSLSNFQTGDFVGVQGSIDQTSNWTIDATLVRDWTMKESIKTNIQTTSQARASGSYTVQGTLSNLNTSQETFTLTTSAGTAYTVSLTPGAILLAANRATLNFSQVSNGDTVRAYGTVASSTITASIFRDVSVQS